MSSFLFVYGTLMSGIKTKITTELHRKSQFLGVGKISGKLFDLGHYPGLTYDPKSSSTVIGHILKLNDPNETLRFLDEYENVGERFGQVNEYKRVICPINFEGEEIQCWTYLYQLPTKKLLEIKSGNYLEYLHENQAYLDFLKTV